MPDTTATERPIIFTGSMVRAILEGRKTQTRRVVKPQPHYGIVGGEAYDRGDGSIGYTCPEYGFICPESGREYHPKCLYGVPGDRLWVRETWCCKGQGVWTTRDAERAYFCGLGSLVYRADDKGGDGWFPSIHMPRWASRIILEITSIRVERLKDISEKDAKTEGVEVATNNSGIMHRLEFVKLWNSINAKRGFGWVANPWVWVITFRRMDNVPLA